MPTNSFCNFFFIFAHLVLVVPQASATGRNFTRVYLRMTWFEAQGYCREHHTDLATIQSEGEYWKSIGKCRWSTCWIGFHRSSTNSWSWSDGENVSFPPLINFLGNSNTIPSEYCAAIYLAGWHSYSCDTELQFICYGSQSHDRLILVKEKKTWEEAVEFCMSLGKDPDSRVPNFQSPYTLAYIDFGGDTSEAEEAAQYAQTEEVWIGLRFLAGRWLWVNGAPLPDQLPICPQPGRYCGAMSKTGQLLHEDCVERRKFLCGKRN